MSVIMVVTKDHPIHNLRHYGLLLDGKKVAHVARDSTSRHGSWHVQVIRDSSEEFSTLNSKVDRAPNYHAAIRMATCYIMGDNSRIEYLRRGIWTNPCPCPEAIL